jgi:hypothetical protein
MMPAPFDPVRILETLSDHSVRYIVIGGIAGRLWGSPTITNDLDICYARDLRNLERLASALGALHARLRGVNEDVPFLLDARTFEMGDHFTFTTDAGNLDCLGTPAGTTGYDDLNRTAEAVEIESLTVHVAALEDLIRMKLASRRPKDLIEVEILAAVKKEREMKDER